MASLSSKATPRNCGGIELKKILRFIDSISEWTGRIFSWVVLILMALVVFEVIMRRFIGKPTDWSFEVTIQFYALHFMIVAAYGLLHGSHVNVDIIYTNFGARTKAWIDVTTYLIFFFPFIIILLKEGIPYAANSWATHEKSWSAFGPPLYYVKTVIPVTAALLLLQGAAVFIRQLFFAIKGEEL